MVNTPNSPAQTPDDRTDQGGNYWTLLPPEWKILHAVLQWNTRYLQAAFDTLSQEGSAPTPALLRHVAPLGWEHISLTGDYIWTEDAQSAPGLLTPLREKPTLLAA